MPGPAVLTSRSVPPPSQAIIISKTDYGSQDPTSANELFCDAFEPHTVRCGREGQPVLDCYLVRPHLARGRMSHAGSVSCATCVGWYVCAQGGVTNGKGKAWNDCMMAPCHGHVPRLFAWQLHLPFGLNCTRDKLGNRARFDPNDCSVIEDFKLDGWCV